MSEGKTKNDLYRKIEIRNESERFFLELFIERQKNLRGDAIAFTKFDELLQRIVGFRFQKLEISQNETKKKFRVEFLLPFVAFTFRFVLNASKTRGFPRREDFVSCPSSR